VKNRRKGDKAGGWYTSFLPTIGEYYRCGACDVESATVPRPGELCLLCRLERQKAAMETVPFTE